MPRGLFIVLEGLDGSGTTTQAQTLVRRLEAEGHRAHFTAEPSSGPIGSQIRMMLAGRLVGWRGAPWDRRSLALLFAADRLDHLACDVEPKLAAGIHVVCDRYVLSSLAYQSLDNPGPWVAELNRFAVPPDVTYFLRVKADVALGRRLEASPGRAELFETLPQQRRIARAYEGALEREGKRHRVVAIDGAAPIEAVSDALWADLEPKLRRAMRRMKARG
ncbi:dTMP kinase [Vulgatibacter incomptus]|uniref:Thymidylate kinase n=1 Tax=Vulgatibacter incomptus TaxID=1391653 RepID=A0A0K1PAG8_9BACT|nr:dTMP kinase [Vulgatibacter incomptus]AKU90497.1 Thymidylate kinase [Vulgatibacter incomptus]